MKLADLAKEIQTLKSLRHQRLIQLHAVCSAGEPVYIVTELMRKGNLQAFLGSECHPAGRLSGAARPPDRPRGNHLCPSGLGQAWPGTDSQRTGGVPVGVGPPVSLPLSQVGTDPAQPRCPSHFSPSLSVSVSVGDPEWAAREQLARVVAAAAQGPPRLRRGN